MWTKPRLLFDHGDNDKYKKETKKNRQAIKVKSVNKDYSDFYYIQESIRNTLTLPIGFEIITIKRTNMEGQPPSYRVNIWERTRKDYGAKSQRGLYVWKSFWVTVCGPGEYIFNPPLEKI